MESLTSDGWALRFLRPGRGPMSLNPTSCLLKYPSNLTAQTSPGRDVGAGYHRIRSAKIDSWFFCGIGFQHYWRFRKLGGKIRGYRCYGAVTGVM